VRYYLVPDLAVSSISTVINRGLESGVLLAVPGMGSMIHLRLYFSETDSIPGSHALSGACRHLCGLLLPVC